MTTLIEHHPKNAEVALLESNGEYWIGAYSPHLKHQNGEPPYIFVSGYFDTMQEGLYELALCTGDEF